LFKGGGGIRFLASDRKNTCRKVPLQVNFLDDDFLHCLLRVFLLTYTIETGKSPNGFPVITSTRKRYLSQNDGTTSPVCNCELLWIVSALPACLPDKGGQKLKRRVQWWRTGEHAAQCLRSEAEIEFYVMYCITKILGICAMHSKTGPEGYQTTKFRNLYSVPGVPFIFWQCTCVLYCTSTTKCSQYFLWVCSYTVNYFDAKTGAWVHAEKVLRR
jgi:hypothetical protein